jgi:hypothetical protein
VLVAESCFELGRAADEQFADLGVSVGCDPHAGAGDRDAGDDARMGAPIAISPGSISSMEMP